MVKLQINEISKEAKGFIMGGIGGYILGAVYSHFLLTYLSNLRNIEFISNILDYLLLKVDFAYFPQLISTIFGFFIGYYFVKKRKVAIIHIILLFCFFIIYAVFWYVFLTYIMGDFRDL